MNSVRLSAPPSPHVSFGGHLSRIATSFVLILVGTTAITASEPAASFAELDKDFTSEARPLIERYCTDCHSTDTPEGDLNLEQFTGLEAVRRHPVAWIKVAEMLDDGQMPPQDAAQPDTQERKQLRDWVRRYLKAEALAGAGDPGPVPLRRLSNAEYGYTIRDLTGIDINPAQEFPADGAAGEGFTNAASALVMSPALLSKYLDAGKDVARHTVLLPDGFRFSNATTRRDQTEEILTEIRTLYSRYADQRGATEVNLQGIRFATNAGGRLPVERYLAALLEERTSLATGPMAIEQIAKERQLSARYLRSLHELLTDDSPSPLLTPIRERWRSARPDEAASIAEDIAVWQSTLSTFQNVGHMKPWVVSIDPLISRQELRLAVPDGGTDDVVLRLRTSDAGDGNAGDFVVWEEPRFVAVGRPDVPLRDLRPLEAAVSRFRERAFSSASNALAAAAIALESAGELSTAELAARQKIDEDILIAWLRCLGLHTDAAGGLDLLSDRVEKAGEFDFIHGWSKGELPSILANASERQVRIPGNMRPHGVAVHPTPTDAAAVGWKSPITGAVRIRGAVTHAHPECGNGVGWVLELRRGGTRQRLAAGTAAGPNAVSIGPVEGVKVRQGDLVALIIEARDGNHSCDLTDLDLQLEGDRMSWSLTEEVSGDILSGNPHADRHGHEGVWHFFTESGSPAANGSIPDGSLLARWSSAETPESKRELAKQLQRLLMDGPPADVDHPDAALYRQLSSYGGPLLAGVRVPETGTSETTNATSEGTWGLDLAAFGKHPNGTTIAAKSLCVQAPSEIEIRLPRALVAGTEFVASGMLHDGSGRTGSVQLKASFESETSHGSDEPALTALHPELPVLVAPDSETRARFAKGFEEFRRWFPVALCYPTIVPTDEVITLTLHHREDEPLSRLMLSDEERTRLDRLWNELHFVSQDALTIVDAYAQLLEYASQDGDPTVFAPLRKPIDDRAAAFREALVAAEPKHLDALVAFAARVYRRPLTDSETQELRDLYHRLRSEEIAHDDAFRLTLSRLFVSPAFLYRLETAPAGTAAAPVTDWELASRLSYFLWSSAPDQELSEAAAAGRLHQAEEVTAQARRMLNDQRARRLATEFACQWLQIYEFDTLDEKSERHFPEFASLRSDMYEEPIRFFTDLFRRDGSILEILDAEHSVLNESLAKHYGIPGISGPEWRRVESVKQYGRGGVLGFSATLAKHSGASRTSPTLRGAWISDVLLGEKLPPPPPDIPELPDEVTADGLSVRELVEKHSADPRCAGCHVRVDPFGFALEQFDSIGRLREKDETGHAIDTRSMLRDGTPLNGLESVRDHLVNTQRDVVVRQFCRKLLGYALGRSVRLSDEPLLDEMMDRLKTHDYRISIAVEMIVRSPQFREIRGRDAELAEAP